MKKLLAILAVFAMTFSCGMTTNMHVNAATTDVTVSTTFDGHTFKAYQILTGTQATSGALGNVAWGSGIDSNAFLSALKADATVGTDFASVTTAKQFAEQMAIYTTGSGQALAVARIAHANRTTISTALNTGTTTALETGYYLIADETNFDEGATNTNINLSVLAITGDTITIDNKTTLSTVEKQVLENSTSTWGKVADYAYGDDVPFKLIANVGDMTHFKNYYIKFTDTLESGKFGEPKDFVVKVNDTTLTADQYTLNTGTDTFTLELNVKDHVSIYTSATVTVEYKAELKANADVYDGYNNNKVKLDYAHNPNIESKTDDDYYGQTEEKDVDVTTYEFSIDKVDGNASGEKLAGVEFQLKNSEGKYAKVVEDVITWVDETNAETFTTDENGVIKFTGLDTGTYTLVETKPLDGYNTAADTNVEITRTIGDTTMDNVQYNSSTNNVITIVNQKGGVLPGTGGMGTTIFYVAGAALVLGAGVTLVSKKRLSK